MYDVFQSIMLKDKMAHHKFESCASWGDRMYIGTGEGAIMVYQIIPKNNDAYDTKGLQIERTRNKLPITQLIPVPQLNTLLVVTGGMLIAHTLDDCTEVATCKGLREVIMVDAKKDKDRIYVASVIRKKVFIHEIRDTPERFHKLREYSLPEGIKTINWSGKNILLGFKKEYVLLDVSKQDSTPDSLYPTSKQQQPIATNAVPMRELLVGEDTLAIRATLEGNPASSKGLTWPSLPSCLCYHHPFVLSIHDQNSIEVRNPYAGSKNDGGGGGLCQFITIKYVDRISIAGALVDYDIPRPTPDCEQLLRNDCIIATTSVNSIYILQMLPIRDQISHLASTKSFDAALDLCQLCPNEVSQKDISTVHTHFGLDHFSRKQFSQAMEHFKKADQDPRFVVSLYSNFQPVYIEKVYRAEPRNKAVIEQRALSENLVPALQALISFLEPLRNPPYEPILERDPPTDEEGMQQSSIDTALLRAYVLLGQDEKALTFLQRPNHVVLKDTESFLRQQKQFVLLAMLWYGKGDHQPSLELLRCLGEYGKLDTGLDADQITHPTLIGTPIAFTIKQMLEDEFIIGGFMNQKAIEDAVMACLPKDVDDEKIRYQAIGVVTSIQYLKLLDGSDSHGLEKALFLENSAWLLAAFEPIYTLKMFTENAHPIPPEEVVIHLDAIENEATVRVLPLCATYLEMVLGDDCNSIDDPNLHNKRAASLIKLVQEERQPHETKHTIAQQKLEKFLDRSTYYEPQIVVQWLQQGDYAKSFYRERAILYRRMKNHAAAIDMYLNEVNKMDEAQKYATEVSKEDGDAFKLLLQYVLKPDSSGQVRRMEEAIGVINECEGVDASSALPMLPGETKLQKLGDFVKVSLRNAQAKRRNKEIYHHTLTTLLQQTEVAARQARSKRCIIEHDTLCVKCRKKIRDTNFARYPNGILVHQACLDEEHICPITGKNYKLSNIDAIF